MHLNARFAHGTPGEIEQTDPPQTIFPALELLPPRNFWLKTPTPLLTNG